MCLVVIDVDVLFVVGVGWRIFVGGFVGVFGFFFVV